MSKANAMILIYTDLDKLKHREQRGLDTLVVYAANYKHSFLKDLIFRNLVNALSALPEEYTGNVETQRN